MDNDHMPGAVLMWMRVLFCWPSVRGPTCVTNSVAAVQRSESNCFFEIAQLAFGASNRERAVVIDHCDSGRIVAAIFELLQPVENYSDDLLITYVTDYSTHLSSFLISADWNYLSFFLTTAGTPTASESAGTSLVTTLPAPVTEPRPTRTGATSIVSLPIFTSSSMIVSFFRMPS